MRTGALFERIGNSLRHFGSRLLVACLVHVASGLAVSGGAAERWNVLFLLTDDQRADTIHALGNSAIRTPHLDELVRSGLTFTRAYCMGAMQGAVCVPSRAMLLSGRSLFRAPDDLAGVETWPQRLRAAGYATFATGKWHNRPESFARSFAEGRSVFFGGMGDPMKLPVQDMTGPSSFSEKRPSGKHASELFADEAIRFLKRQQAGQPFCASVAFTLPHDPRIAPAEYRRLYNASELPLPKNCLPEHPFNNGEMLVRDEQLAPWPRSPEVVRQHVADYYAAITHLDAQIGRIFGALKQAGVYDKTVIVFASDHGLAIGSHGLFGKQNLYEHSMRAPLIFAGPGIPKDRRSDALCYLFDVAPTVLEWLGVPALDGIDGRSLAPILRGETQTARDSIFLAYRHVQRAVRDDRWKWIRYPHINKSQLFDLRSDPDELCDLAGDPAYASQVSRLSALMSEWQKKVGDAQSLESDRPQPLQIPLQKSNGTALRHP